MPVYDALSYVCGDITKNPVNAEVVDQDNGADMGVLIDQNLSIAL